MKFVRKESFEPETKPVTQNLQNEFYQKKAAEQKVINIVLTLGRNWMAKKSPKISSEIKKY